MAQYPSSAGSDANLWLAKNNLGTALVGAHNNSITTITVTSTTGFPTTGYITIDAEAISYTGTTSTTFTGCVRGADGTVANSHLDAAIVNQTIVADHHNVLKNEIIAVETDLVNAMGALNSGVTPASTAATAKARFDHFAAQVQRIQSSTNWYDQTTGVANRLYNVRTYGAVGNGVADDSTAIQAAITAASGAGGGQIYFPQGTYKIGTALTLPAYCKLVGQASRYSAVQITTATDIQLVNVTGAYAGIENIHFGNSSGTKTQYGIYVNAGSFRMVNCTIDTCYTAIKLASSNNHWLQDLYIYGPTNNGIEFTAGDSVFGNIVIANAGGNGVLIDSKGNALYVFNMRIVNSATYGVWIKNTTGLLGDIPANFWFFGVNSSIAGQDSYRFDKAIYIYLHGCTAESSTNASGIYIDAVQGLSSFGGRYVNNKTDGVILTANSKHIQFTGDMFSYNGVGSTTYSGLHVQANTTNFRVDGCWAADAYGNAAPSTQKYGIVIDAGSSNNYQIVNNWCLTNVTAGISDGGTGATKIVMGNMPESTTATFIRTVKRQTFTASGTYTPSTGMVFCDVEAVGGGGGGGGSFGNASGCASGGGGGAGGYARKLLSAATVGASQAITIGAAGTGATAGANAGGTGGNTTVGALITAYGGNPGQGSSGSTGVVRGGPGNSGGSATGGDVNLVGESGATGIIYGTSTTAISGKGGSSKYGEGGAAVTEGAAGNTGTGFGAGGAGGASSTTSQAGGAGTAGLVLITEYCNQ